MELTLLQIYLGASIITTTLLVIEVLRGFSQVTKEEYKIKVTESGLGKDYNLKPNQVTFLIFVFTVIGGIIWPIIVLFKFYPDLDATFWDWLKDFNKSFSKLIDRLNKKYN